MPIARQADGLWVYLDSSEPEQRMPLKQLQQQHGHEVVGALLITAKVHLISTGMAHLLTLPRFCGVPLQQLCGLPCVTKS